MARSAELTQVLVGAVRKYAVDNYEHDGWDYLVECWSDDEIARQMGGALTAETAIRKCKRTVKLLDDRRRECEGGMHE